MKILKNTYYENNDAQREASFRQVYEMFYHSLLGIAYKYVEVEIARDIVQDTFLQLWNSPEKYLEVNDLRFYLYRAIRNRCLNHIRNRKVESKYLDGVDRVDYDFFYHAMLEEEIFLKMRTAIDGLPDIYREVLMFSIEGLSDKEIAQRLSISTDNVKTRKKRGKSMLREKLKNTMLILLINLI